MGKAMMCEEPGCYQEGHFFWTPDGHVYLCGKHADERGLLEDELHAEENDEAAYEADLWSSAPNPDRPCEVEGCDRDGTGYPYPGGPRFLCDQHAVEAGYCPYCGAYVRGTEDELDVGSYGMCSDCLAEVEDDEDEVVSSGWRDYFDDEASDALRYAEEDLLVDESEVEEDEG